MELEFLRQMSLEGTEQRVTHQAAHGAAGRGLWPGGRGPAELALQGDGGQAAWGAVAMWGQRRKEDLRWRGAALRGIWPL